MTIHYSSRRVRVSRTFAALVLASAASVAHAVVIYDFAATGTVSYSNTTTAFTPSGATPGADDSIVFSQPNAGALLNVNGTARTLANLDASAMTANQTIAGASGAGGTTLTITGTLWKGLAA